MDTDCAKAACRDSVGMAAYEGQIAVCVFVDPDCHDELEYGVANSLKIFKIDINVCRRI